jgi:leucyl-tRNA synthetase
MGEESLLLMAARLHRSGREIWAAGTAVRSTDGWPEWDAALAADDVVTIVVQVNGKVRDRFEAPADIGEDEAKARALATEGALKYMEGRAPKMVKVVPGKLVTIVV